MQGIQIYSSRSKERQGTASPLGVLEKAALLVHLNFKLLDSRIVRDYIFAVLSTKFMEICYSSHWELPYFAVYNKHFLAQIFEGKIRMHIIHG